MEVTTTMVRFLFPKDKMVKKEKAMLFLCEKGESKKKVWVPLSKLDVKPNEDDERMNEVVIAKWLFLKGDLVFFVEPSEFIVKTEITSEQLAGNDKFNN